MSLVPAGAAQPTLVAQLPRDSAVLRRQLAERAPLLECERSLVTDNLMRLAAIDPEYCPESSDSDACYLLSQDALLGSIRSLECLALRREHKQRNLPAFHHWGFLSPACWSYVEVRRRAFRSPQLAPPEPRLARLALEAAQEWAHPDDPKLRGALRLAVLGRCLPFLLDDLPHQLAQGQVRHDAVSTTVTRLRAGARAVEETRRVSVVGRVVVDARSADALAAARHQHAAALNPLVVGAAEAAEPGGRWGGRSDMHWTTIAVSWLGRREPDRHWWARRGLH